MACNCGKRRGVRIVPVNKSSGKQNTQQQATANSLKSALVQKTRFTGR